MEKDSSLEKEKKSLDIQANIVAALHINQTLQVIRRNELQQLEKQEEALNKATKANTASRRPDTKGQG